MTEAEKIQTEIYKRMTPIEKLQAMCDLYNTAYAMKTGWVKQLHSEWTDKQVDDEVMEIFLNSGEEMENCDFRYRKGSDGRFRPVKLENIKKL
ncbi:MAG: hypothetical protein K9M75_12345 [Phycisphaerae bacterium]|nr:hypothetical protein [Phycisphaerae bacterium]